MADMDLQEKTRMLDTYNKINNILDEIGELDVFPALVWVWSWEVAQTMWKYYMEGGDPDYCTAMEIEEVWERFWLDADKNGFSLEFGVENLDDSIRDWLMDIGAVEIYDGEEEDE